MARFSRFFMLIALAMVFVAGNGFATIESASWGSIKVSMNDQILQPAGKVVSAELNGIQLPPGQATPPPPWGGRYAATTLNVLQERIEGMGSLIRYTNFTSFSVGIADDLLVVEVGFPAGFMSIYKPARFWMEWVGSDGSFIGLQETNWKLIGDNYMVEFKIPQTGSQAEMDLAGIGEEDRYFGRLTIYAAMDLELPPPPPFQDPGIDFGTTDDPEVKPEVKDEILTKVEAEQLPLPPVTPEQPSLGIVTLSDPTTDGQVAVHLYVVEKAVELDRSSIVWDVNGIMVTGFSASLIVPPGTYTITVTGQDMTGNTWSSAISTETWCTPIALPQAPEDEISPSPSKEGLTISGTKAGGR